VTEPARGSAILAILAAGAAAGAACTGSPSPFASAQRLGTLEDAIGGPHAIGRVGDFLLENDQIRLVIAGTGKDADPSKSVYGRVNTTFGGTLVDADLRRPGGARGKGNDQLAELLPGFAFTVIDPTEVKILKDGADGGPAEVQVEGVNGDLLQMLSLLNTGLLYPSNLTFRQIYRLQPGKRWVEIETTVINSSTGAHPLPFLDPTQLDDLLGRTVPNIGTLQLSVPMGQLPLLGGEQDLFAPGVAGFNIKYAIEDSYKVSGGFPGFPGLPVDFLASRGNGVSYGLTIPRSPDNYVNAYAASYAKQEITPYSILLPFNYAGVTAAYMYKPPAVLQPNEQFSFTSYFVIGRGDVASVADAIYELRGEPTGTFGGRVVDRQTGAPVAKANVMVLDAKDRPVDQIETDEGGAFLAKLPPGTYSYTVMSTDRLSTPPAAFEITPKTKTGVQVQMDAPATIVVSVIDDLGRHAPAKVNLVGRFDPADQGKDPRTFLYSLPLGESKRPTAFDGTNRFLERAWWTKDGRVEAHVRPGTYDVIVSRGPEYELATRQVTLRSGGFATVQLALTSAFQSDGWIAGDFHLHAQPSTDSGVSLPDRVVSCAAEGLEVATATDHNYITDYGPSIAASGLDPWLLGIPGMELTTFEMGHFNAYPLRVDPGSTRGGEFVWAKQPPQRLFDQLRGLMTDRTTGIVQANHPRQSVLGYFSQFFIDANTAEPYTPTGILGVFAPYGDEFCSQGFSYDFEAIELLTGNRYEDVHNFIAPDPLPPGPFPDPQPIPGHVVIDADGRPKYPGVVDTWFTMLNRGHRATGMGVSDSHGVFGDEPGYARTMLFVGKGKDKPGAFTREDVITAIRQHRTVTTNGPLIEMTAGTAMIGDTVTGRSIDLRVHVRAPSWAKVNRLVLYSNALVIVDRAIPADQGTDYDTVITFVPPRDAWVVAEVYGQDNMFPVITATELPPIDVSVIISALGSGLDLSGLPTQQALKPATTHIQRPYAITSPIWIDIDGNGWTAPLPPLPDPKDCLSRRTAPRTLPDVRAQFEKL
jgi:hypothetical protein